LGEYNVAVLCPRVDFRWPLLPPEALVLADVEALDADRRQALLHLVQLEGFDDRLYFFHGRASRLSERGVPLVKGLSACKPADCTRSSLSAAPLRRCFRPAPSRRRSPRARTRSRCAARGRVPRTPRPRPPGRRR